jgi:hypothetical protein
MNKLRSYNGIRGLPNRWFKMAIRSEEGFWQISNAIVKVQCLKQVGPQTSLQGQILLLLRHTVGFRIYKNAVQYNRPSQATIRTWYMFKYFVLIPYNNILGKTKCAA